MIKWPGKDFFEHCIAHPLTPNSANGYASYLRNLDKAVGGLDVFIADKVDTATVIESVEGLPAALFGKSSDKRNSLSALRVYLDFKQSPQKVSSPSRSTPPKAQFSSKPVRNHIALDADQLSDLYHEIRSLALRYRNATGKPLGVTGELAELAVSQILDVELAPVRTAGFDGWLMRDGHRMRVQIKGRAVPWATRYVGRCPAIKCGDQFDIVLLVLIDNQTMQPREIWEADEKDVIARLTVPGSKSRNERNSMGISQFKTIARLIWSELS